MPRCYLRTVLDCLDYVFCFVLSYIQYVSVRDPACRKRKWCSKNDQQFPQRLSRRSVDDSLGLGRTLHLPPLVSKDARPGRLREGGTEFLGRLLLRLRLGGSPSDPVVLDTATRTM